MHCVADIGIRLSMLGLLERDKAIVYFLVDDNTFKSVKIELHEWYNFQNLISSLNFVQYLSNIVIDGHSFLHFFRKLLLLFFFIINNYISREYLYRVNMSIVSLFIVCSNIFHYYLLYTSVLCIQYTRQRKLTYPFKNTTALT